MWNMKRIIRIFFLLIVFALWALLAFRSFMNSNHKLLSLPGELHEISGMEFDLYGNLWGINDGGNTAELFQIDSLGTIGRSVRISNATNMDWEDLTQDDRGNFFIGDFGNNRKKRRELTIYKMANPADIQGNNTLAEIMQFEIDDANPADQDQRSGNFDVEAFVSYYGRLYLFTKNHSRPFDGYTRLYRLEDNAGVKKARLVSRYQTCKSGRLRCWVTGAALSPDRKKLALLGSNRIWVFRDWTGDDFFTGNVEEIDLGMITQKEAIAFKNDSTVVLSDEKFLGIGGNLYSYQIE